MMGLILAALLLVIHNLNLINLQVKLERRPILGSSPKPRPGGYIIDFLPRTLSRSYMQEMVKG
jgi:hypothetical protein